MSEIIEYIRRNSSREHPIKGKDLADYFGIVGSDVRKEISNARCNFIPICSSKRGYYFSNDKELIAKTIESLRRRIASQEKAIEGMKAIIAG